MCVCTLQHDTYLFLFHKGCGGGIDINILLMCLKYIILSLMPPPPFSLLHPCISFHLLPWQLCLISSTLPLYFSTLLVTPFLSPLFFFFLRHSPRCTNSCLDSVFCPPSLPPSLTSLTFPSHQQPFWGEAAPPSLPLC